jgi:hypothetical protein
MKEQEMLLTPALYSVKASGKERNSCKLCGKKCEKGEAIVELFSSAYRGNLAYANRFHKRCFLKTIAIIFPEILTDEKIKKEIIVECLTE